MTKVIKGEFEKLKDLKVEDVSLTYDTSLKVFNNEFNWMNKMDDDLFTYEVEVANIPCDSNKDDDSEQRMSHEADDDTGYDPSDVAGDDEVELTDEEFSDNKEDDAEVFRIDTNIFNFAMPMCKAFNEFNYLLQIDIDLVTNNIIGFKTLEDYIDDWIYEWNENDKPWLDNGIWKEPKPVKHTCKPFNYKTGSRTAGVQYKKIQNDQVSFRQDEEYAAIKEDEYDDLARTSDDACQAYQEIFRMMNEGWMITRAE
nr:hypothetical protein [Tanacetum cinerariifolium]